MDREPIKCNIMDKYFSKKSVNRNCYHKLLTVLIPLLLMLYCYTCFLSPALAAHYQFAPLQQGYLLQGKVVDIEGLLLSGVTIREQGTQTVTSSNDQGHFVIHVKSNKAMLSFTRLGYQDLMCSADEAQLVEMQMQDIGLEEVIVVGFGTQKKINLTGAISHLGKEALENRPVANIGQALHGAIPNLNINFRNGAPNTTPNFNLRGGTSFSYNQNTGVFEAVNGNPLVIIDGVEGSTAQLNQLNPNDILDISFIKDASAAAIFGTKAPYGVILVRSKRGEFNQAAKISYGYDLSFDTPAAIPDILNSVAIQESAMNKTSWTGGVPSSSDVTKLENLKKYIQDPKPENAWFEEGNKLIWVANTNPFDEVVRNWTPMQKHNLSTSGGGSSINYYLSLGLQRQQGMYKINTDEFTRYNGLLNLNTKVKSWFNLFTKLGFDQSNYATPYIVGGKGSLWNAMMGEVERNINMPILTGPNDPIPNAYTDNILAWVSYGARNKSINRRISLVASPEFIFLPNKLTLKADLAYLPQSYRLSRFSPKIRQVIDNWSYSVQQAEAAENRAFFDRYDQDNYSANIYANYRQTFGRNHNFAAIAGFNQERFNFDQIYNTFRKLLAADIQNPNVAEDPTLHTVGTNSYTSTGRAAFGRINYDYKGKYLFESNMRYDGSSKFPYKDRFVSFPSFSAGWRISEEQFMDFSKSWLNDLKVRGSWGKLGNQPASAYPYQAVLVTGKSSYMIDGNQVVYMNPPGLVSPNLTFEKAETSNLGVDLSMLANRLQVTAEVYRRQTTDILSDGAANYPSVLGTSAPYTNSGTLKTNGFELSLQWRDKLANGIHYRVGLNLSDYFTTVVHYAGNSQKLLWNSGGRTLLYDNMRVGEIWGYHTGGILQEADFEKQNPNGSWEFNGPYQGRINANLYPGYLWYRDLNGDGKVDNGNRLADDSGDLRVIGNETPRYKFGFTGNVQYKGFDLDFLFQGVLKRDVWTSSSAYWGGGAGSRWMLDRSWTPERTAAQFPMYTAPVQTQTAYLINGAYLRLKQAVLGYTLPKQLMQSIGVEKARFTLASFNLFEITKIPGIFDPDQITSDYPQKRSVSFGLQVTF